MTKDVEYLTNMNFAIFSFKYSFDVVSMQLTRKDQKKNHSMQKTCLKYNLISTKYFLRPSFLIVLLLTIRK